MKTFLFAFAFAVFVSHSEAQIVNVTCNFITINNVYTCMLINQVVIDIEGQEFQIVGNQPGRRDEDVQSIFVRGGSVPLIINELFNRMSNIFRIIVESNNNGLNRIQSGAFANAGNLQWISVDSNPLTTVEADAFLGASSLRTLDLRNNQINRISVHAFNGLANLRDFMLENNQLHHLQANLFRPLTNVQLIYLTDNQIESIEGRLFARNQQLRHVDFTRNQITEIESNVLDGLDGLEIFIVAGNRCVSNSWVVTPLETIREGLKTCFENFE